VSAAGLATYGIRQRTRRTQAGEGPRARETVDRGAAASQPMALFSEPEMGDFPIAVGQATDRIRGEPRLTVEGADNW